MQRKLLLVTLSSLLVSGCGSTDAPNLTPVTPDPSTVSEDAENPQHAVPAQQKQWDNARRIDSGRKELPAAPLLVELASEGVPPEPVRYTERILLLTGEGPLVIEAGFRIDGHSYARVMQRLLDKMLDLADTNRDGVALWEEVIESPHFRYGQFGNAALNSFTQKQQVKRQYDVNSNGRFDREEVSGFLTQNNGSSQPFRLRDAGVSRGRSRSQSPVMRLLDYDEDGRLDLSEMVHAKKRLQSRDADADEILVPEDFVATADARGGMRRGRRSYGLDSAILLGERVDWDTVSYILQEVYGGDLTVDVFRLVPELHSLLDLDEDGRVSDLELRGLNSVTADICLHLEFGRRTTGDHEDTEPLQLVAMSPTLRQQAVEVVVSRRRIVMQWSRFQLAIYMNDTLNAINEQTSTQMQFEQADADGNGYLEADEFPNSLARGAPFEAVDQDGDGRLYVQEMMDLLSQRQAVARSQIVAQAGDHGDALFHALDTDQDGRLVARELEHAVARLQGLDENQDEFLRPRELPESMRIVFARGNRGAGDALFNVTNLAFSSEQEVALPWFRRMDENADGDISVVEFLGTMDQFRDLDANADGFITEEEVRALQSSSAGE